MYSVVKVTNTHNEQIIIFKERNAIFAIFAKAIFAIFVGFL